MKKGSLKTEDLEVIREKYYCSPDDFKRYAAPSVRHGPLSLFSSEEMKGVGNSLRRQHVTLRFAFRLMFEGLSDMMIMYGNFLQVILLRIHV